MQWEIPKSIASKLTKIDYEKVLEMADKIDKPSVKGGCAEEYRLSDC